MNNKELKKKRRRRDDELQQHRNSIVNMVNDLRSYVSTTMAQPAATTTTGVATAPTTHTLDVDTRMGMPPISRHEYNFLREGGGSFALRTRA